MPWRRRRAPPAAGSSVIGFHEQPSGLTCDEVPVHTIVDTVGTPCYVYSARLVEARYRAFDGAFAGTAHSIHYALKANSTLAIVRLLRGLGAGVDANSGGEIEVALRAGLIPSQIVFSGVGKTRDELERAIALGVRSINVESAGEIDRVGAIASALGVRARVAVRLNPDVDARSHPHISTGLRTSKFGVPAGDVPALARRTLSGQPALVISGLHVHVGSQIVDLEPIRRAVRMAINVAADLRRDGVPIEHVDVGGGLGIPYDGNATPDIPAYAAAVLEPIAGSGLDVLLEPGRVIVGPAGALLARVVDVKPQAGDRWFVVVDAGMTELLRPALYNAYHRIVPATAPSGGPEAVCDVVGPLCETSDTLGAGRTLALPQVGDVLAVLDAGAYGSVMGSNYNRRPGPPEVLVSGAGWRVVRRRQSIDDLLACEE
jgi:diaminopimelate decarboxylase